MPVPLRFPLTGVTGSSLALAVLLVVEVEVEAVAVVVLVENAWSLSAEPTAGEEG